MSRLPVLVAVLALLVAGCGSSAAEQDLAPLAEQADRVATLLDDDRPCEAATAARELGTMAQADVSGEVRDAVTAFAEDATSAITCPPEPTEPPPPSDTGPPEGREDEGGDEDDKDDKDEARKDEGKKDDDSDDGGPPPGRGEGRGGGDD